jgi:hypothetical protein
MYIINAQLQDFTMRRVFRVWDMRIPIYMYIYAAIHVCLVPARLIVDQVVAYSHAPGSSGGRVIWDERGF